MKNIPESAGLSSFNLLDQTAFFQALDIRPGMTVLDLGCGLGNYAIDLCPLVGTDGFIHAFDLWEEGIEILNARALHARFNNIRANVVDVTGNIPVEDRSVDLSLMATIIHILIHEKSADNILTEVRRVLKPEGVVAIVEFKKMNGPPGPPLSMRLSPPELDEFLASHALRMIKCMDIGPYNYLSFFKMSLKGKMALAGSGDAEGGGEFVSKAEIDW